MHRAGIFRSSVLVDIVNYAGVPLLAIYFFSMFAFPWIDGQGSWAHVQAVWDRWQSLNAGALAFLAIQLLSAWLGIFGSLLFAIGVVRRSTEAKAMLSGSYYGSNPHMPRALSAQKRDSESPE